MESQRLAAIPLFSSLPADELAAVAAVAGELDIEEGNALTVEGDLGHAVFAIEHGTADVICDGATIGAVGPGDVIGEVAVLASGRRTASVVATSPMRLISLFKRDVWALERDAPKAATRLRELLGARQTGTS
jgi:CRP/FNR family transcriptional regulator, cyclic AMP receptor protein